MTLSASYLRWLVCVAMVATWLAGETRPVRPSPGLSPPAQKRWNVGQILRPSEIQGDSTFFNPEGYYFPADTIDVAGYRLDSVMLGVLDYTFDGRFHADSAQYVPEAMVLLLKAGEDETSGYRGARVEIAPDSLDLLFAETPIGEIRILGAFVDKRGHSGERDSVQPFKTEVLRARVSVVARGKQVYSRDVAFTYWEGD